MTSCKLGIIDLGIGNINSVQKALTALGVTSLVSDDWSELNHLDKLILPGVGSFAAASQALNLNNRREWLVDLAQRKPLLGICVGMQILATLGLEHGANPGLDIIAGQVSLLPTQLPLPHVGWNSINHSENSPLLTDIPSGSFFYFTHSYAFAVQAPQSELARCTYGVEFTCALAKGQVFGVQFHPEKSQQLGLQLLQNFVLRCG